MPVRVKLKYECLAKALARKNLSQNHWAQRLRLNKGHLSQLVNGKRLYPSAPTRKKLLEGLQLDFDDLFAFDNTDQEKQPPPHRSEATRLPPRDHRWLAPLTIVDYERNYAMKGLTQDVRFAFRNLRRHRLFALTSVLTIAIGIGANAAIFSVVYGVLLKPFPFAEPERIMTLWQANRQQGLEREEFSAANFYDAEERSPSVFESAGLVEPYSYDYIGGGEPVSLKAGLVTENFFAVWGIKPLYGRAFLPEEFTNGKNQVAVISYGLWQMLGGDPEIIGRELKFDNGDFTVVGIMPSEFRPRLFEVEKKLWAPRVRSPRDLSLRSSAYLKAVARLKTGVTVEEARLYMDSVAHRLEEEYPEANGGLGIRLIPLPEQLTGETRPALLILLVTVALVLLIACANMANLLLARNTEREKSFAIRAALGAGRWRLVSQLMTESSLMAAAGAVAGLALALGGLKLIKVFGPASIPRLESVTIDANVLIFSLAVSVVTVLLFGLGPSLQFSSPELQKTLREGGRSGSSTSVGQRTRSVLIVAEVAISVVLLVGAGLLARSFISLVNVDPGFSAESVVALQTHAWGTRYPSAAARAEFFERTLNLIKEQPDVSEVGIVSNLPFFGSSIDIKTPFVIEGRPTSGNEPDVFVTMASAGYFKAMKIPLLQGRLFDSTDHLQGPPVVVINRTMARIFFPQQDPVGSRIQVSFGGNAAREIVGVVGDVRHAGLNTEPEIEVFLPHSQLPYGSMTYVVKSRGDTGAALEAARRQIWSVDPLQSFYDVVSLEGLVSDSLAARRFHLLLLGGFSAIAFLLSAVGIYGVISFSTNRRFHEIGVRMALGAGSGDILWMVVGRGVLLASAGILTGVAVAMIVTRFLQGMLFGVTATDPLTFLAIAGMLLLMAGFASYLPARRAVRIDPNRALRYE